MEYIIFCVCLVGAGYTSYRVGVQEGSEKMLEMLEYIGIVTIDDDDNVYPNKSYVPTYRVKK